MDEITLGTILLALASGGILAASAASVVLELAPRFARRQTMRHLGGDLHRLAAEHAASAPARERAARRHSHHCPACGRFARLVTEGPRATWTRCKAHGLRAREVKRVGRPERHLVSVTVHRPLVALELRTIEPPLELLDAMRPTHRAPDWLDGTSTPRPRLALAA